jgi:alanine dehydrogenase
MNSETLLLSRTQVAELLTLEDCIAAVETVFRLQGEGKVPAPGILGIHAKQGGLHIKAALLDVERGYVVAKANTNFPRNPQRTGLPTIQGVIIVCDAENGFPLAVMDSIEVTIKRTAAASAVAAKYLARNNSSVLTICGCGAQGETHLRALNAVLSIEQAFAFDVNARLSQKMATAMSNELKLKVEVASDLRHAIQSSDVCVTCTPSREFFVHRADVRPGAFIAAVGADNEYKQEIDPALMASAKVVADSVDQCSTIGDSHHAITAGFMTRQQIYAELAEIVAGRKPGRSSAEEIIIFDSTGIAIEDAIAAAAVYEKACAAGVGTSFSFSAWG